MNNLDDGETVRLWPHRFVMCGGVLDTLATTRIGLIEKSVPLSAATMLSHACDGLKWKGFGR